jgi:hypothetical protein
MTEQNALEAAVDAVARRVVRDAIFDGITGGRIGWDDYPELSENDWHVVSNRALHLANGLETADCAAAYELLAARAEVSQ